VQTIRQAVYPNLPDADDELKRLANHTFRLSPKDHWDQNGVLSAFKQWAEAGRKAAFWIGGSSGNQDNWVTEMSIDLIRALDSQDKVVAFVFCDGFSESITPLTLLERLIMQLLQAYPLLAFHNPEYINARRLRKAESFHQLWSIWQWLIGQTGEIFIIIDLIDKCTPSGEITITSELLPRLVNLVPSHPQVSMVITSNIGPPSELQESNKLQSVWVNTAIPASKRYDRRG
jgi:hypothetical protein